MTFRPAPTRRSLVITLIVVASCCAGCASNAALLKKSRSQLLTVSRRDFAIVPRIEHRAILDQAVIDRENAAFQSYSYQAELAPSQAIQSATDTCEHYGWASNSCTAALNGESSATAGDKQLGEAFAAVAKQQQAGRDETAEFTTLAGAFIIAARDIAKIQFPSNAQALANRVHSDLRGVARASSEVVNAFEDSDNADVTYLTDPAVASYKQQVSASVNDLLKLTKALSK